MDRPCLSAPPRTYHVGVVLRSCAPTLGVLLVTLSSIAFCPAATTIQVAEGFRADILLEEDNMVAPVVVFISNPAYGVGVLIAGFEGEFLLLRRLNDQQMETFTRISTGFTKGRVSTVAFDWTGSFGSRLYATIRNTRLRKQKNFSLLEEGACETLLLSIDPSGGFEKLGVFGGHWRNGQDLRLAFADQASDYPPGIYLLDADMTGGSPLLLIRASAPRSFERVIVSDGFNPAAPADLDIRSMVLDTTGQYSRRLLCADCQYNQTASSGIYILLPDLITWQSLVPPVKSNVRCYQDLALSTGGVFGERLYVTDVAANVIDMVSPSGDRRCLASGLDGIGSLSMGMDGNALYAADRRGVYRIREATSSELPMRDCNDNKVRDEMDVFHGTAVDCNGNAVPDECEITQGLSHDCNMNGRPDECDIAMGADRDCNNNGIPDSCEVAAGTSQDIDENAVLDECQATPPTTLFQDLRRFDNVFRAILASLGIVVCVVWLVQRRRMHRAVPAMNEGMVAKRFGDTDS